MPRGLSLRGLGSWSRAETPEARTRVLDEFYADPETGVAPGVTQGRNMRSRY
jgi:hypothetical protein